MKKLTIYLVLAALCLNFPASAQENLIPRGLQPGDPVPSSAGLDSYRGQLLIIDFWATWCSPCRAMMPVADSINQELAGKALILPVTYESEAVAGPVLSRIRKGRSVRSPERFNDQALARLFPHRSLPHYVWIDARGTVRAITESGEITRAALQRALREDQYPTALKRDVRIPYDPARPLFAGGNGGAGEGVQYRSVLSGYVPGLRGGLAVSRFDTVQGQRFTVRNAPLYWLLNLAYGERGRWFIPARIRNRSKDAAGMTSVLSGALYEQWLASGHGYCYELQLPPRLATSAYPVLQAEMSRLFPQYRIRLDTLEVPCLALVRKGKAVTSPESRGGSYLLSLDPFACKLSNVPAAQFLARLERQFLANSPLPLADATGLKTNLDLSFQAGMTSVEEVNRGLAPYGLALEKRVAPVPMLLLDDNPDYRTILHSPKP